MNRRNVIELIERFLPTAIERRCSIGAFDLRVAEEYFRISGFFLTRSPLDWSSQGDAREFAFRGEIDIVRTDLAEISRLSGEEVSQHTVGLLSDHEEFLGLMVDVRSLNDEAKEMLRKPVLGLRFEHLQFRGLKRESNYALEGYCLTSLSI